jgi:hypothetical protein
VTGGRGWIAASVRFRPSMRRSLQEASGLLYGGMSENETMHQLLAEGLAVMYARRGIKQDPAELAGDLLSVLEGAWSDILSDDELAAFAVTRQALKRCAQIRARDPKTGD